MKSTGIVRKLDNLGRIVLPKELRRVLQLNEGTPVEIFVDGNKVVLEKYTENKNCVFCGNSETHRSFMGKGCCASCLKKLAK